MLGLKRNKNALEAKVATQTQFRSHTDAMIAAVALEHPLVLRSMGLKVPMNRLTVITEQRAATYLRLAMQPIVRGTCVTRKNQILATDLVAHVA